MDETLVQLGTEPISTDVPAGVSVRYEPEFEQLQDEIAKLESVDAVPVNWSVVVDIGVPILRNTSKDLLVACYVCHGLYERDGYAGLNVGLTILTAMVNTFWDGLFPELKRSRARVAAIEWLVDRLGRMISERKPGPGERDDVAHSKVGVEQLEEALKRQLGEQTVAFGELYRPLRDFDSDFAREEKKQQEREAQASVSTEETVSTVAATSAVVKQVIATVEDASRSLRSCQEELKKVVAWQRETNVANPDPYRLLRIAIWIDVAVPPLQNNETQIPEVPAERLAFFDQQVQDNNHILLINEVESTVANAPFWLGAHRLTATALEALGHQDARQSVISNLAVLLRRLPELLDCKFLGGQPFADDLTRLWIESDVLAGGQTGAVDGPAGTLETTGNATFQEAINEARQLATKGEFRDGISIFQAARRQAASRREGFLWDLQQAHFCQEVGHVDVAISQLESLNEEAERYHLEAWEPELSLQIAASLLVCYKKAIGNKEISVERAASIGRMRSRVSRLDAATAIDLIKKT